MRPSEVLRRAADYLERHGVESPRATAEVLMATVLATDRAGLYSRSEGLNTTEAREYGRALCQRCSGMPLQHLTGVQHFRHLVLEVRPGVFIPRPETEVLVDVALGAIKDVRGALVVDVGTGTGAIALSIAWERPDARVLATDLSPEAVALSRTNAGRLGLDVEVLEGDGLQPLANYLRGRLDLIVSNPPYVTPEEYDDLPAEVRADPVLALVGGTGVHAEMALHAACWLRSGGVLAMETGAEQAAEVAGLMATAFEDVRVAPDLAGRDRIVSGRAR